MAASKKEIWFFIDSGYDYCCKCSSEKDARDIATKYVKDAGGPANVDFKGMYICKAVFKLEPPVQQKTPSFEAKNV